MKVQPTRPFLVYATEAAHELARIHADGSITYADGVTPEDVIRFLAKHLQSGPLQPPAIEATVTHDEAIKEAFGENHGL